MRAAVMRNKEIVTDTLPDPVPGSGEVLVKTLACGICGSDLHMLRHADKMMESMRDTDAPFVPNLRARRRDGPRVLRRDRRLRPEHAEADPGRQPRRLDADQLPRRQAASGRLLRTRCRAATAN